MPKNNKKKLSKQFVLAFLGMACLVVGIALILIWWRDVVSLFHGAGGMILALAGLLMLYTLRENI